MRREARFRESLWFKGGWVDDVIYAILRSEWERSGVCGDDCAACPRLTATETGDPQELGKVKQLWVRLGLRDASFPAEKLACHGCLPENDCAYPDVRACARVRSLPNCGWCPDYPCALTAAIFERTGAFSARVAEALVFDDASPNSTRTDDDFAELHRQLWSWGAVPFVYRRRPGRVDIFR